MKSIFMSANPLRTDIRDVPIPLPERDEVFIKVMVCGSNPKDWKFPVRKSSRRSDNLGTNNLSGSYPERHSAEPRTGHGRLN
jgi:NADPH:quinone reductase-like Zn-dependent oxidoreductase